MKNKSLLSLSTFIIAGLTLTLIGQQRVTASDPIFFCESDQDIPTTIAKSKNGQAKPIFHWNLNEDNISAAPQQLCEDVTQKLNNYEQAGNDLSSLILTAATVLDDESLDTFPVICIAGVENSCKIPLITLSASANPLAAATQALDSILDKNLKANPAEPPTRGLQSTAYEVDFWQLWGF